MNHTLQDIISIFPVDMTINPYSNSQAKQLLALNFIHS